MKRRKFRTSSFFCVLNYVSFLIYINLLRNIYCTKLLTIFCIYVKLRQRLKFVFLREFFMNKASDNSYLEELREEGLTLLQNDDVEEIFARKSFLGC